MRFRLFLGRYRVAHEQEGWQADLLSSLHDALTHKDRNPTSPLGTHRALS